MQISYKTINYETPSHEFYKIPNLKVTQRSTYFFAYVHLNWKFTFTNNYVRFASNGSIDTTSYISKIINDISEFSSFALENKSYKR